MSWDRNSWDNDAEDSREVNGIAFQKIRRENSRTELAKIQAQIDEGLSDEALAKAIRRQNELNEIISFVDEILGEKQGAEQEF